MNELEIIRRYGPPALLTLTFALPMFPDAARAQDTIGTVGGTPISVPAMERSIEDVMEKARIPALSVAVINDAEIVYVRTFGVRSTDQSAGGPPGADEATVFAAASFSKTVFAWLVLLLVDQGVLDLDTPLHEFLERPLVEYPAYADLLGDGRYRSLTARLVLSHQTGFPNWRAFMDDARLQFMFDPGARFSYSGEGVQLLQMVVEEVTDRDIEELARELIFEPLGMNRTAFLWQDRFEDDFAAPHDRYGRVRVMNRPREPGAAGSMQTTAGDYAGYLAVLMQAERAGNELVDTMWQPQVSIRWERMFGPGIWTETDDNSDIDLAWTLGWGTFETEAGRAIFHTGQNPGFQNYTVTYLDRGVGVVLLSNSDNFESVARELVAVTIGDADSPFDFLGYPHFDPAAIGEPPPETPAVEVDPALLEEYAGRYTSGPIEISVRVQEGGLQVTQNGLDWIDALAESDSLFFIRGADARFGFETDDAGRVAMVVFTDGTEIRLARLR